MSVTFATSLDSVVLPNPTLGDAEQHNILTAYGISMGKTVYSTKKTVPRSTLLLTFTSIKAIIYQSFQQWYIYTRGLEVTYTDYNGKNWVGIIKNNPVETTVTGHIDCPPAPFGIITAEVATFTIQFEAKHS
jgi:hypothetical protein